jgi:hypothetical protein
MHIDDRCILFFSQKERIQLAIKRPGVINTAGIIFVIKKMAQKATRARRCPDFSVGKDYRRSKNLLSDTLFFDFTDIRTPTAVGLLKPAAAIAFKTNARSDKLFKIFKHR